MFERSFAAEFDRENGGKYVVHNGWLYYANGARRESSAMGLCLDPPDDKFACAKAIALYHKLVLDIALQEFHVCKDNFKAAAETCLRNGDYFGEEEDAVKMLTDMKKKIAVLRQNFTAATQAVENLKPKQLTTDQRMTAENRREAGRSISAIKRIRA